MLARGLLDSTTIAYSWTVADRQAALLGQLQAVNGNVAACTSLDTVTRAGWTAFYSEVSAFCAVQPSWYWLGLGARLDQVENYTDALSAWQKVIGKACTLTSPVVEPVRSAPDYFGLLQWGVYGVLAVAGAYAIGQVAPIGRALIPAGRAEASERRRRPLPGGPRRRYAR